MPYPYSPIITPDGRRTNKEGEEICGRKLNDGSGWCASQKLLPIIRRCRQHPGGHKNAGMANPRTTHGMTSRYIGPYSGLPQRMIDGVVHNLTDPKLMALREEVAITMERAADLIKRVDHGESGHLWIKLKTTLSDLESARRSGDADLEASSFAEMRSLIEQGTSDYQGWEEIGKQFDRKQRLAESEWKKSQTAPAEQVTLMITNLVTAIRECVTDAKILAAVQARFNAILGAQLQPHQRPPLIEGTIVSE